MPVTRKTDKVRETFKKAKANGPKPIWDLYRDGLTQGAISTFLDCPHQFWLGYVMGYRNKAKGGATAFGSAFHDILAMTEHAPDGKKPKSLDQAVKAHLQSLGELTPSSREEVNCMLAQIKMLITEYNKHWSDDNSGREWIKREDTFKFFYSIEGHEIPLRGRWDGVYRKGKKSRLRLHETKTKGRIDEEGIAKSLPFDTQTMLYSLAIKEELEETPSGTCYDIIRTPQQRLKVDEKLTDFVDRIRSEVVKDPAKYFLRFEVTITPKELEAWETRFLRRVLASIVKWWESIKEHPADPWKSDLHYMRPGAFWSMYGRSEFFEALTSGNTFSLERKEVPFPELVD